MSVVRGFTITIVSGLAFGVLGAGMGYLLGLVAPDYYRTVFRIPLDVSIDPAQAGLGLGVKQGVAVGLSNPTPSSESSLRCRTIDASTLELVV